MRKIIFTLICSAFAFSTVAQNIIRPKIAGPNDLWVNSYNGVLFFGRTDFETQNSAMPMQLRFYYNSSANDVDYGYGLGFSLGYEMRYEVDELNNVTIRTGDGRTDKFTLYGDEFESPAGVFSFLTYSDGKYVLTEKTGETYEFADAHHKCLTAQTDRNGNRTTLTYSADSMLIQIQDAVGHTIFLTYDDKHLSNATATFLNGTISYSYDAKKRLTKCSDAMGHTTVYGYDRENHLDEITDANGNTTHIFYNASDMVSRMKTDVSDKVIRYDSDKTVFIDYTAPLNQYSYYRWDEKGRVVEKVGLCCGTQSTLVYDEDDNVIKRTDANGNVTTYTYDDCGNMLSLTDPLGKMERYTYDETFNQVTSFSDKNGNTYNFSYDSKGNLTSFDGPLGFVNSFTYDEHGWQLTSTDANNNVTATTYNVDGTVAYVMDAAGYHTRFSYDQCGNLVSLTDANNNTATYVYDKNNRVKSEKDALGNATEISYDKVGNVVRVKNAKNQITAYVYDALGHVVSMTDAMGGVYTYTYDGKGNVLTEKNPHGIVTAQTWNDRNKILSQTNGAGEVTSYDYDANGNLIAIFQPNGNVLNYTYDALDRVIRIEDNMGIIAVYTYDGNGNQLTITDGLDRRMTYTYDALNRKTSECLPSGTTTTYTYDKNSNLLKVTDAQGNATVYTYSSLNQQLSHTDALNAMTVFEYDGNGNMSRVTDANGNATSYTYDALNRNTQITFANGASLQYTYDELGRVIASKDRAGNEFKYRYNALGYLLSKVYPDNTSDRYTYDAACRMLSAVNNAARVEFVYDKANRLLSETLNGKVTGYSYDVAKGIRKLTYPSGMKVEEHLNARDLITSIIQDGEEVVTMEYNVAGQKTRQTYANGIITDYTYNQNGWLDGIVADHDVLNYKMIYDAVGNITERQDLLDGSRTESYGYDVISQLTSFRRGTTVDKTYQFDLLGNRVKTVENGVVTNYTSNNVNAYTSITGGLDFTPSYDGNGNMLNDDKHSFKYDYNNKLVAVDETVGTYRYDALGRRVGKTTADGSINFYYVGDQMVEEVHDGNTTSYLFGNEIDEALQMNKDGDNLYFHCNHLGSTICVTDNEDEIVEYVDYDCYGNATFNSNNPSNSTGQVAIILFSGREYDFESGTYYFRTRTYNTNIGRFHQKDPRIFIDGMNDIAYTRNNPVVFFDVYGTKRNIVVDFLFGGCLDMPKNWRCADNVWQKAGAVALCGLDVAGFIPIAGLTAKGVKSVSMVRKASKLGKVEDVADAIQKGKKYLPMNQYISGDPLKGPLNYGAVGSWRKEVLPKGHIIDRYGKESGQFFADAGTPLSNRSLRYTPNASDLHRYEVINDLPVWKSIAAPAYGKSGGGVQYVTEQYQSIESLIAGGYIRQIK